MWYEITIGQRQLQAEVRNAYFLGFGASYITDFTVRSHFVWPPLSGALPL